MIDIVNRNHGRKATSHLQQWNENKKNASGQSPRHDGILQRLHTFAHQQRIGKWLIAKLNCYWVQYIFSQNWFNMGNNFKVLLPIVVVIWRRAVHLGMPSNSRENPSKTIKLFLPYPKRAATIAFDSQRTEGKIHNHWRAVVLDHPKWLNQIAQKFQHRYKDKCKWNEKLFTNIGYVFFIVFLCCFQFTIFGCHQCCLKSGIINDRVCSLHFSLYEHFGMFDLIRGHICNAISHHQLYVHIQTNIRTFPSISSRCIFETNAMQYRRR